LIRGYDPKHKIFNSEVEFIHDLEPLEVTDSDAEKFKEHGDKCDIWEASGSPTPKQSSSLATFNIPATFSIVSKE
jgi:fatty acid synthase subunit beta